MAAKIAFGLELLDEPLERQLAVRDGVERSVAHAGKQLGKGGLAGKVVTKRERVDEEPDRVLELGPGAIVDGSADDDVALTGVPVQKHVERREQRHEERSALALGECGQSVSHMGGNPCSEARRRAD